MAGGQFRDSSGHGPLYLLWGTPRSSPQGLQEAVPRTQTLSVCVTTRAYAPTGEGRGLAVQAPAPSRPSVLRHPVDIHLLVSRTTMLRG